MELKRNLGRASYFVKWLLFAIVVGVLVGLVGVAFHYSLEYASEIRLKHPWTIYLLPFAGIIIVWLYSIAKMSNDKGANLILISIRQDNDISIKTAPLIFIATVLTHLFGGSAGREGAALQLGASISDKMARILKINNRDKKIITICGMAAGFSAVFGTPVTAVIFSMEVISVGVMYYAAIVPCITASAIAFVIAKELGVTSIAFDLIGIPDVNLIDMLRVAALGILCAALAWLFCFVLRHTINLYSRFLSNPYLKITIGGILVIIITKLVGNMDYNGAGINIVTNALGGVASNEAFVLKILMTAITIGAGYKGGEIVPSFFIGSTFGCVAGGLIGLNPSFSAGLGMVGVFCGVTNCPMTSIIISIELFGAKGIVYFAIMSALCYMLSGYNGLYSEQKILYSKFKPKYINRKVNE